MGVYIPPVRFTMDIPKIDDNCPNSLDLTTSNRKIYQYKNKIYISFDNDPEYTKVITLDLIDFSYDIQFYNQLDITTIIDFSYDVQFYNQLDTTTIADDNTKSNSFIYQELLFQIKANEKELGITIKQLPVDNVIKTYRVDENNNILFKNSSLIEEEYKDIYYYNQDEVTTTANVLEILNRKYFGISVNELDENIELIIGRNELNRTWNKYASLFSGYKIISPKI